MLSVRPDKTFGLFGVTGVMAIADPQRSGGQTDHPCNSHRAVNSVDDLHISKAPMPDAASAFQRTGLVKRSG